MLGKIVTDKGKVYNIYYLWSFGENYIKSLEKIYPRIFDLVVRYENKMYLCWPDPIGDNWSFLKALEGGVKMKVSLGKRKTFVIGSEEAQEVDVLSSMRR